MKLLRPLVIAAFALTAAPSHAQTKFTPPFIHNGTAQAEYIQSKLDADSKVDVRTVMRFVQNVFGFYGTGLSDEEAKTAYQKAADASIDLANTNRAGFEFLQCVARENIARPIRVFSAKDKGDGKANGDAWVETPYGIKTSGDFKERMKLILDEASTGKGQLPYYPQHCRQTPA